MIMLRVLLGLGAAALLHAVLFGAKPEMAKSRSRLHLRGEAKR